MKALALLRRIPRWVLVVVGVIGMYFMWGRLRAEYYYLRINAGRGEAGWFRDLEAMGSVATPVLIRLLADRDRMDRYFASQALGVIGDERAVPALMEVAANDTNLMVQGGAITSLAKIKDPRAVPLLKELSWTDFGQDPRLTPSTKNSNRLDNDAVDRLRFFGEEGKQALLEYFETHPDPSRRAFALRTLCRPPLENDPEVRDEIRNAARDPMSEVRVDVARCLPEKFGEEAIPLLKSFLEDESPAVRAFASRGLGKLGDRSGYTVAMDILKDRSLPNEVRGAAARALGEIGDQNALPTLKEMMEMDSSNHVREQARRALRLLFPIGIPRDKTAPEKDAR
jgi:HEAT repeat protein